MKPYFFLPLFCQKLIWFPSHFILSFFGHLEVKGLENLKDIKGNAIFAANHISEIDPFLVPTSLPFWSRFSPLFYATREKEFYSTNGWRKHLFGGLFINAWGGYGVKVGLHDYSKALVEHIEILRQGGSFCVFPEGGISRDGNLQVGKGGVTFMAAQTGTPIVPVAFSGNYKTSLSDFFLCRRHITVSFGKPIYQEEFQGQIINRDELGIVVYKEEAKYVMKRIGELLL